MNFSERLKNVRFGNNKTQQYMADALGMSLRMYSYYENGKYDGQENRVGKYLHKLAQMEGDVNNVVNEPQGGYLSKKEIKPVFMENSDEHTKYVKFLEDTVAEYKKVIADLRKDVAIEALKQTIREKDKRIEQLDKRLELLEVGNRAIIPPNMTATDKAKQAKKD